MDGETGGNVVAGQRKGLSSLSASVVTHSFPLPGNRRLTIAHAPAVMGVINTTPDSFSDGGVHLEPKAAIESALRMVEDGAAILDIGGESTRPGAEPVPLEVELRRVIPVIEGIRAVSDVPISIDTMKAYVAEAAMHAGADIVNDISAMRFDERMPDVVRDSGATVILMHMRGEPQTMQQDVHYDDLIGEIVGELKVWRDSAIERGIEAARILVDPGIGFGKSFAHNIEILAGTAAFAAVAPVVIGASRKGFIGSLIHRGPGRERAAGSLAAVAAAATGGAAVVRVHDVRDTVDFLRVFRPILGDV